jgi:hypothetical protein
MATGIQRMRIQPTWRAGIRRGKPRNSTMLLLQRFPEFEARLRRAEAQLRAWGVQSMPLDRVREPFDYDRR